MHCFLRVICTSCKYDGKYRSLHRLNTTYTANPSTDQRVCSEKGILPFDPHTLMRVLTSSLTHHKIAISQNVHGEALLCVSSYNTSRQISTLLCWLKHKNHTTFIPSTFWSYSQLLATHGHTNRSTRGILQFRAQLQCFYATLCKHLRWTGQIHKMRLNNHNSPCKAHIQNLGTYVDIVKHKWLNKIKET